MEVEACSHISCCRRRMSKYRFDVVRLPPHPPDLRHPIDSFPVSAVAARAFVRPHIWTSAIRYGAYINRGVPVSAKKVCSSWLLI